MRASGTTKNRHWRGFLKGATAGVAALAAGRARARGLANDLIGIGLIGVGDRGSYHLSDLLRLASSHNVRITALCDVQRPALEAAAERVAKGHGTVPATTTRFGELLEHPDVDAVVIATPDFSHGTILCAALEADRDVYVEKPMTIDLGSANRALDLARSRGRVVQAGTQRRSDGYFRAGAEVVDSGVLGTINRVSASIVFNQPRWARDVAGIRSSDIDWEAYLLHLPARPFDARLLARWQLYRETSNGMPGLWMTHYADAVHLLTGAGYPSGAIALGGIYVWKDGREHADTFHALLVYPEGFLFDWGMGLGNASGTHFTVHGTRSTLDAERWTLATEAGTEPPTPIPPISMTGHMANGLECLRSRATPAADIETGHQHAVATILAAQAFEAGRKMRYDPERRTIDPA